MGKSGKLLKSFVAGVKAFKSPSKERLSKEKSATDKGRNEERDLSRKARKEKCMWSLGKSSSRNRDIVGSLEPPTLDVLEVKDLQVEEQQLPREFQPPISSLNCTEALFEERVPTRSADDVVTAETVPQDLSDESECENWSARADESEQEEWAAVRIQAAFRSYLAQQQFRALKAVIRLQALARGRMVRKQAATTLQCIQAVVKFQAHARGHSVRMSKLGQLVQQHLEETRQQERNPADRSTVQEFQMRQETELKHHRVLAYAFTEQLRRCTPKQNSLVIDCESDKNHWGWVWLDRWMAARPWENSSSPVAAKQQSGLMVIKSEEKVHIKAELEKHVGNPEKESVCGSDSPNDAIASLNKLVMQKIPLPPPPPPPPLPYFPGVASPATKQTVSCAAKPDSTAVTVTPFTTSMASEVTYPSATSKTTTPSEASSMVSEVTYPAAHITQPTIVTLPCTPTDLDTLQAQLQLPVNSSAPNPTLSLSSPAPSSSLQQSELSSSAMLSIEQKRSQQQHNTPTTLHLSPDHVPGMSGNSMFFDEALSLTNEKKNAVDIEPHLVDSIDDTIQGDAHSETNGRCSLSTASASSKPSEGSTKRMTSPDVKHDQGEGVSPSVPSYMATTQSSKAKTRSHASPKQISESPKQRLLSPKQKLDPALSASRKRHSLSGLEGKSTSAAQRQIVHVRAGSKGQLASLRDGSTENSPGLNGDSRRYGK